MTQNFSPSKNPKKYFPRKIFFLCIAGLIFGLFLIYFCCFFTKKDTLSTISNLQVCHLTNPLGIDEAIPTFGWQMQSSKQGAMQSAYRLTLATDKESLSSGNFYWDSGKITSGLSTGISYEGPALIPKQRYFWQVTVWDETDTEILSTENAWFETGLMTEGFTGAKWISAPQKTDITYSPISSDLSYDISYETTLNGTGGGFIFGAHEGRYGKLYLCEMRETDTQILFRFQAMDNGTFLSCEEVDITTCKSENSEVFSVNLSIREENLTVTINETPIGNFAIESTPIGSIGYYKSRSSSFVYFDNILATDSAGNLIYEENFEGESTIFSPYHIVVEDGKLRAGSGFMLTPFYESPAPYFRREFALQDKSVKSARMYLTALGSFALSVNGERVSDDYFSPGKLAFNKQLSYMTYDVTSMLKPGEKNALGIILLHGWYDRAVGYPEIWNPWGDTNALLGQLEICYEDGSREIISTDQNFLCHTDGPIRSDDIYQGEYYDATKELTGFDLPGYDTANWQAVACNEIDDAYLSLPIVAKQNEPIVCIEELTPISVTEPVENVFVYDFGRNFTGTCRISSTGQKGQILTLRYGEEINTDALANKDDSVGCIWTVNLLTADATDYYVMKGALEGETFTPEFTFHGFRYLQITGLDEPLAAEQVTGLVLSSNLTQTGSFESSNSLLNQFYQNTINTMQSNFLDNPTDCPQRDERHGWTGDAQVFSRTASYHANTYSFYQKYLEEMRLLQTPGGSFTDMAPRNFGTEWDGTGGAATNNCWGDAPVVITWNLYTQYGDKRIIEENYDALCKWVDVLVNTSDNYLRFWGGYGDHLALESTPTDISDTAWCAHSADLLSKMAKIMNKPEDATHYNTIYENFKKAWQNAYVLPDGMTVCNTQTSYALGLCFDLFPAELKTAATGHLLNLLEYGGYHINTGFSGISYLLPALSSQGQNEAAYRLLLQEDYPSLIYQVKKGATTTWELWNGYQEEADGTYRLSGSLNHYTYGAPASWLYTHVLGIQSDENLPGYKHILLEPQVNQMLTYARGSYFSPYGEICISWEQAEGDYHYTITIPANTTATLKLPALPNGKTYLVGNKSIEKAKGVSLVLQDEQHIVFELVSGNYSFTVSE